METSVKYVGDGYRRSFKIGFAWGVISDIGVRVRSADGNTERKLERGEYKIVSDCVVYDLKDGEELEIYLASPLARALLLQEDRIISAEAAGISAEKSLWYAQGAASLAEEAARQSLKEVERLPEIVEESKEDMEKALNQAVQTGCSTINDICASGRVQARDAINDALKAALLPGIYAVKSVDDIPKGRPGFYVVMEDCEGHRIDVRNFTPVEYVNGQWLPCDHHHEAPAPKSVGPFRGVLYHVCKDGRYDKVLLETSTEQVKDENGKSLADILEEYLLAIENATANNVNGLEQKNRIDALEAWKAIAEPWRVAASSDIGALLAWKQYADARLYIPDDVTIKATTDKRIYVNLKSGGGILNDDTGLYVNVADLIQLGGGLAHDANGRAFVDFSTMPTDKFEVLLKSLQLPIWLSGNTTFYVDRNHAAASDALDDGRGLTPTKPFKNIQACVNYVADNYNLGNYNATINVAPGDYRKDDSGVNILSLPQYTTGTGKIILKGEAKETPDVICDCVRSFGAYLLRHLQFKPRYGYTSNSQIFSGIKLEKGSDISMQNLLFDFTLLNSATFPRIDLFWAGDGAKLTNTSAPSGQLAGVKFTASTHIESIIRANSSAFVSMQEDLHINGTFSTNITINCMQAATVSFDDSGYRSKGLIYLTGAITGKRYQVTENGILNTRGGGPEFIPGSTAGTVSMGGQYG